jgi:hypothetical protein
MRWRQVPRPRLRDDILGDFWDRTTTGAGGMGVRNTLSRMIVDASAGGPDRTFLDVELFGKFVRFTGPARVAVLLLSGDVGSTFEKDAGLRQRLEKVMAMGGEIVAVWLPDCRVDDHREWWPASMAGVLDWNTSYVDLRNKTTWAHSPMNHCNLLSVANIMIINAGTAVRQCTMEFWLIQARWSEGDRRSAMLLNEV